MTTTRYTAERMRNIAGLYGGEIHQVLVQAASDLEALHRLVEADRAFDKAHEEFENSSGEYNEEEKGAAFWSAEYSRTNVLFEIEESLSA